MNRTEIRNPVLEDTKQIIKLVRDSGKLDVNSAFYYALWIKEWSDTCAVAVSNGRIVGVLTGFIRPTNPTVYFSWQACISHDTSENDLGFRLYKYVLDPLMIRGVTYLEMTVDGTNRFVRLMLAKMAHHYGSEVEDGGILFSTQLLGTDNYSEELRRIRVARGVISSRS